MRSKNFATSINNNSSNNSSTKNNSTTSHAEAFLNSRYNISTNSTSGSRHTREPTPTKTTQVTTGRAIINQFPNSNTISSKPSNGNGLNSNTYLSSLQSTVKLGGSSITTFEKPVEKTSYSYLQNNETPVEDVKTRVYRNEEKTSSSFIYDQNSTKGLKGLQNIGNTCYMNSVLQALFNLPKFSNHFLEGKFQSNLKQKHSDVTVMFADLLSKMKQEPSSKYSSYENPSSFKRKFDKACPKFSGFSQEDAQEFLVALLEIISNELNTVIRPSPYKELDCPPSKSIEENSNEWLKYYLSREKSVVTDLFMGQLYTKVVCANCKHEECCFDQFWSLLLQLPTRHGAMSIASTNLNRLLSKNETEEQISDCVCGKCKKVGKLYKTSYYYKLPEILTVVLKRFKISYYSKEKNTIEIEIPFTLMPENNKYTYATFPHYELCAVVNHSGGLYGGHYTSDCKNPYNGKWYKFNDGSVTESYSFASSSSFKSSSAYILFYTRK